MFALLLVPLFLIAALAIDFGNLSQVHESGQNAVDEAALSGAGLLGQKTDSDAQVATAVEAYLQENFSGITSSEWDNCPATSTPPGFSAPVGTVENCVTFNGASSAISVVLPPQLVRYAFAQAGALRGTTIETSATAMATVGTSPCAICVLGPSGLTFSDTGSGTFTVTDTDGGSAGILVDSNASPALKITGSGSLTAPTIGVVGSTGVTGSGTFSPAPATGVQPVSDPLAYLSPPPSGTTVQAATYTCSGSSCSPNPIPAGTYSDISVTGGASVTIPPGTYNSISVGQGGLVLESGIYVITGQFSVPNTSSVTEIANGGSTGVLLYFTCSSSSGGTTQTAACSSGETGGSLSLTGSPTVDLSPMTSGPYAGVTVFYDRNNSSATQITGGGGIQLSGTFYAKSSALTMNGSGGAISSMVVVGSVTISGGGSLAVDYSSSENAQLPGVPYLCSVQAGNCP